MKLIDLSAVISNKLPVYPGDPVVEVKPAGQLDKDGFADHLLSIGTHVGTHIDAPMHMLKDGKTLNQIPLEQFVGRGVYIQVPKGGFSKTLVEAANIQEGDIVVFHTGRSDHYNEEAYFHEYPALSEEVAQHLIDKKVKMVGFDTCSADTEEDFPIHKQLLSNGVLIIENLVNVGALSGIDFTIYALPLNLEIDGSPARVIAQVN